MIRNRIPDGLYDSTSCTTRSSNSNKDTTENGYPEYPVNSVIKEDENPETGTRNCVDTSTVNVQCVLKTSVS
jgi:hypothetical protein